MWYSIHIYVQRNDEVADTSEEQSFDELGSGEIDEGLDDAESSRTIWFVSEDGSCPCQYKTATGIACRHTIAVSTLLYKQRLLADPSGILGGAAIPYWLVTSKLAIAAFPKPQHTAAHVVIITCHFIIDLCIYTTTVLSICNNLIIICSLFSFSQKWTLRVRLPSFVAT